MIGPDNPPLEEQQVPDDAREVNPFSLNKDQRSTAPEGDEPPVSPDDAHTVSPLMFIRPGEDYYISDDPDAVPVYSDFRAAVYPAESSVEVPGEGFANPKGLSVPESATSSPPSPAKPDGPQEVTVQPEATQTKEAMTEAAKSLEAVDKDSGPHKENESSTQTFFSMPETNDGNSTPPA